MPLLINTQPLLKTHKGAILVQIQNQSGGTGFDCSELEPELELNFGVLKELDSEQGLQF